MTAYILKTVTGLIVLLILVVGFYFQMEIRRRYPGFDPTLLVTGVLFFAGMIYAVMDRNIIIAFITITVTVAIPYLKQWVVAYWPY
ncbi:MAG: hypothetical protein WBR24_07915 [Desulfobacterales bacterium]